MTTAADFARYTQSLPWNHEPKQHEITPVAEGSSEEEIVAQLLYWYEMATQYEIEEGRSWYADHRELVKELAREYEVEPSIVAAVISALSPQTPWQRNVAGAIRVIRAFKSGEALPPYNASVYRKNTDKAWRLLQGSVSPEQAFKDDTKTRAFWRNLAGDETAITIDTWLLRAMGLGFRFGSGVKPAQYRRLVSAVRRAARKVGEVPAQFQAIVWVVMRSRLGVVA